MADGENDTIPEAFINICTLDNHMGAVWDNQIYIVGGYQNLEPQVLNFSHYSSRHMRILDFDSNVDIAVASSDIITTQVVPDRQVPPIKWGNMFAQDGKLHIFGGQREVYVMLHDNLTVYDRSYRRPTHTDKLFTYDIESREWEVTSLGLGPKFPCCTNVAHDEKNKVGWVYGGVYDGAGYWIANDGEAVPEIGKRELLTSLVRYDITQSRAEYVEIPTNPVGHIAWGSMTFIEGVGEEGVLILFGGANSDQSMDNLNKIHVFDIASRKWYTQDASSEGGNQPPDRVRFCTVVVSAEDRSSHNIFMYAGRDIVSPNAYSDVYVLSIPSFHWIYLGAAAIGKSGHSCLKVQEKYLISYRGMEDGRSNACDRENGGIQIYDMEALEWTTKYEVRTLTSGKPTYKIPEQIYSIIGGGQSGNATFKTPRRGWSDDKLGVLFQTRDVNPTNETETSTSSSTTVIPTNDVEDPPHSNPIPTGAIAGGIIGGVAFLVLIILVIYFWRKRARITHEANQQWQPQSVDLNSLPDPSGRKEGYFTPSMGLAGQHPIPVEVAGTPRVELSEPHPAAVEITGEPNFGPGDYVAQEIGMQEIANPYRVYPGQ